jgi:hypothetical protein
MSWNDGYVSELAYISGYTQELNPLVLNLALLAYGHQPSTKRPLRYLELGFGQGLSLNIHAAACDGEFWGIDFNPSHVINAKAMTAASGANVTILDDSFAEFATRDDLPEFDVIALHGVWSWISTENREAILETIRSKLALGGVLYVSYNTTPGWSMLVPIQHLMMLYAKYAAPLGSNAASKVRSALDFTQQLIDIDSSFFNNAPSVISHVSQIKKDDLSYLVHEYYNNNWAPMSFAQTAKQLTSIKLTFVGDAIIKNLYSNKLLAPKIQGLLADINDPLFYQSVYDYCVNQQFRKDVWIKGGNALTKLQQLQLLADMRFVLLFKRSDADLTVSTNLGSLSIDKKIAWPILDALAKNNFQPKTINELLLYPELSYLSLEQTCEMMLMLCGVCVAPANDEKTIALLKPRTDKLNGYLIHQSQEAEYSEYLASPVTGGGWNVSRLHQLALLAIRNGFSTVDDVAIFIGGVLSSRKQFMVTPDGKKCLDERENLAELNAFIMVFFEAHLPILTALKIS